MQYIKVLATESTNTELKKRFREDREMKNTCLSTHRQTQGIGQRGTHWYSKDGMNLTFSLLLTNIDLDIEFNFKLSALVSFALVKFIRNEIQQEKVFIKWPNDILADNQKICGILIENLLKNNKIHTTIIGIGLNVNQTEFESLQKAGSLKMITKKDFNLDKLLVEITNYIETEVYAGLPLPLSEILKNYESHLFRIHQNSIFQYPNGDFEKGVIEGIQVSGKMLVNFNDELKEFGLKEIKLIY